MTAVTTVITGGASGIGLATALRLLEDPEAQLAVLDFAVSDGVRAQLPADRTLIVECDAADGEQITHAAQQIADRFGSITGLVTSAGVRMQSRPILDLPMAEWDRVLRNNLTATFVCCQKLTPLFGPDGAGSIVLVSSISARRGRWGQSAYGASKAGVVHLAKVLALELAEQQIRVNAVCPGLTLTPMIELAARQEPGDTVGDRIRGNTAEFRPGIPLRRAATAEDQAAVISFLLSPGAQHVTGQSLLVDGGESVL